MSAMPSMSAEKKTRMLVPFVGGSVDPGHDACAEVQVDVSVAAGGVGGEERERHPSRACARRFSKESCRLLGRRYFERLLHTRGHRLELVGDQYVAS